MGNTIKDVALHLRVGWNMVKDIHKKYLKSKYSRPNIKDVHRIGIDEFATHKGHVYKTIVVDLDTGSIIHVGDGKGKEALEGFWERVRRNNAKIEIVTSDLSAAFIASVMENAPDAVHVYDKFHVVKLVNEAVDTMRRHVYAQETDLEKRKVIKGSRWLLLTKDKERMKPRQATSSDELQIMSSKLQVGERFKTRYPSPRAPSTCASISTDSAMSIVSPIPMLTPKKPSPPSVNHSPCASAIGKVCALPSSATLQEAKAERPCLIGRGIG